MSCATFKVLLAVACLAARADGEVLVLCLGECDCLGVGVPDVLAVLVGVVLLPRWCDIDCVRRLEREEREGDE